MEELVRGLFVDDPVWNGLIGGLVITAMNAVGALAILVWRRPSQRFLNGALG